MEHHSTEPLLSRESVGSYHTPVLVVSDVYTIWYFHHVQGVTILSVVNIVNGGVTLRRNCGLLTLCWWAHTAAGSQGWWPGAGRAGETRAAYNGQTWPPLGPPGQPAAQDKKTRPGATWHYSSIPSSWVRTNHSLTAVAYKALTNK